MVFQALCFNLWLVLHQLFANQEGIIITSRLNKNGIFVLKNTASDLEYTSRNWRFLMTEWLLLQKKYHDKQLMSLLRQGQETAETVLPCSFNSAQVEMREQTFGERSCKISVFASKLLPFDRTKAHASEVWGLSNANGKSSCTQLGWSCLHLPPQVLLSMLDGNYRQTRPANHWHQINAHPAFCNSHHATVFTVKMEYVPTYRLIFPHLFSLAQITSYDNTEPNF